MEMSSGNPCLLTEPERSDAGGLTATLEDEYPPKLPIVTTATTNRHKCPACFKQYKKKEHLVDHIKTSRHSVHEPKCGVCQKHCKSLESLREHIAGPLFKVSCSRIFTERGCSLCLKTFDSSDSLSQHSEMCCLPAPTPIGPIGTIEVPYTEPQIDNSSVIPANDGNDSGHSREVVAIDCAIVGGGSDGSLDLCARVCLVDEDEKIIFHTYVIPEISITDYRYDITGITKENIRDAMRLEEAREKILHILYNNESISKVRMDGGRAKALVGHNVTQFVRCLEMDYPDHLLRDTAKYPPLGKTNFASHSLKYLAKTYLGFEINKSDRYDIQDGVRDPYQYNVTALRLYKRMRSQDHQMDKSFASLATQDSPSLCAFSSNQLESMTPDELLAISISESKLSNFWCWCLDSRRMSTT